MKVVVVANQKGGVGKSTLSCNLAVVAAQKGKRVLIIDADPQGSSMQWRAQRAAENVSAIAITKNTIVKEITNFENFDLVFVDAGGRDNSLFRAAVVTAQHGLLLVPVLASGVDVWATEDTFKILGEARAIGANIPAYAVFNQVKTSASLVPQAKEALWELTEGNDIELLETQIGNREDFKKAFLEGLGVTEPPTLGSKAPHSPSGKAAAEITNLFDEIMAKLEG